MSTTTIKYYYNSIWPQDMQDHRHSGVQTGNTADLNKTAQEDVGESDVGFQCDSSTQEDIAHSSSTNQKDGDQNEVQDLTITNNFGNRLLVALGLIQPPVDTDELLAEVQRTNSEEERTLSHSHNDVKSKGIQQAMIKETSVIHEEESCTL